MRLRSIIVHAAVLLVATIWLALAQTASAEVREIADFAAGEVVSPGGFPTGGYVFVPRFTESTNRFSIVRISPSGQRKIAVRRPVPRGDDNIWGDQFPEFSGSESIVAARIDLWTDGSEGGWITTSELVAGPVGSRLSVIDRCPAGPVDVHGPLLAELSRCDGERHFRVRIFKAAGPRLRLIRSIRIPRSFATPLKDSRVPAEMDAKISINHELVLLAARGGARLMQWRRDRLLRDFKRTGGSDSLRHDIVFAHVDRSGNALFGVSDRDSSFVRFRRGSRDHQTFSWPGGDSLEPGRVIGRDLILQPSFGYIPSEGLVAMNLTTGRSRPYGPPRPDHGYMPSMLGGAYDRDVMAWSQTLCDRTHVFVAPRTEVVKISEPTCSQP